MLRAYCVMSRKRKHLTTKHTGAENKINYKKPKSLPNGHATSSRHICAASVNLLPISYSSKANATEDPAYVRSEIKYNTPRSTATLPRRFRQRPPLSSVDSPPCVSESPEIKLANRWSCTTTSSKPRPCEFQNAQTNCTLSIDRLKRTTALGVYHVG